MRTTWNYITHGKCDFGRVGWDAECRLADSGHMVFHGTCPVMAVNEKTAVTPDIAKKCKGSSDSAQKSHRLFWPKSLFTDTALCLFPRRLLSTAAGEIPRQSLE
jgi:hypothetical protein